MKEEQVVHVTFLVCLGLSLDTLLFFFYPLVFLGTSFNSKEVTVCDSLSTRGDSLGSCPALRETLKMTHSHCLRKVLNLPLNPNVGAFSATLKTWIELDKRMENKTMFDV